jgi:uncharacterized protein with PQ loop repeat
LCRRYYICKRRHVASTAAIAIAALTVDAFALVLWWVVGPLRQGESGHWISYLRLNLPVNLISCFLLFAISLHRLSASSTYYVSVVGVVLWLSMLSGC